MRRIRIWVFSSIALAFAAVLTTVPSSLAADNDTELARELIDRFYDALAPNSTALEGLLSDSFQIIGNWRAAIRSQRISQVLESDHRIQG